MGKLFVRLTNYIDAVAVKRALYTAAGVGEYWIFDVEERNVTRFVGRGDGLVLTDRLEWKPEGAARPFVVELPSFFDEALR